MATADGDVEINEHFASHPKRILGQLRAGGGHRRKSDPQLIPP